MTYTCSTILEMTARSWVIRISDSPISRCISWIIFSTCAWMVTSRAVVGSSAIRMRGPQAIPRAIMARCRIPPLN